ncbi:hypothetical protein KCU81_g7787, partial [Aureobasidium melanogenum]|uniref:Uncharacterized protein n=1 Tax=Aureobasidium melanogenum (strain CBS 110374) TaxID=1043003 RepID=A0A074VH75_AURM1
MSTVVNITPQPNSQKRKGGRAPLPEVEENFTRLPPGPGDRTERAVCKHCQKERSWHTTELVKHLDKCVQYTPSKRAKFTRPWRIERPGDTRSPNQPQSQQPSPQQLQNATIDLSNPNVRVGSNAMFQWDGGVVAGRLLTTSNADSRPGEEQPDGLQDSGRQPGPEPRPQQQQQQPNHHILHTPSQSLGGNTDYTNTPNFAPTTNGQPQLSTNRPSALPPPVNDPDQRLHSFIEYERGATAWQTRPEDLEAIEAWLQHHRVDIEDIKEITDTRWVDSWQLKLGDLYRIKRDVQTFKVFSTR